MGVDYFVCRNCGDTFSDAGSYVTCEGCGEHWCSHECAEKDGYVLEYCATHPELDNRDLMEEYREEHCDHGDCTFCDHYVSESCGYCRGEKFDESFLLETAIEFLGISNEMFMRIVKSKHDGDNNWINRYRRENPDKKVGLSFMTSSCPCWNYAEAVKLPCVCGDGTVENCIECWHSPCEETAK